VVDQRQLEHARPGPQLADAQRCHGLERVHEPVEPLRVEACVAVAEQFHRHREHTRSPRAPAHGELGQLAVVTRRQVAADLAQLPFDQVEVVEQPLGRRRTSLAVPHVARRARDRRRGAPGRRR
jgi:hypothetical protein